MPFRRALLAASLATALSFQAAWADPFTFQGYIQSAGAPVDGSADLRFRVYSAATTGSQIGDEVVENGYPVAAGVFSIDLDFGPGLAFDGSERFLEVEVDGQVLTPRFAILPAPASSSTNALRGRNVSAAMPSAGDALVWTGAQWAPQAGSGGGSYLAGIGMNLDGSTFSVAPTYRLPQSCSNGQVAKWNGSAWACMADADTTYIAGGGISLTGTTFSVNFAGNGAATTVARSDHNHFGQSWTGYGSHGLTVETDGAFAALRGFGNAGGATPSIGVLGEAADSNEGIGVRGRGNRHGVQGQGLTDASSGVYGVNSQAGGAGVGVSGESAGVAGVGVYGRALHASGLVAGVRGESASALGSGVEGFNTSATGGSGLRGRSGTALGRGVLGENTASSGDAVAVYGVSSSGDGFGVMGFAAGATGTGAGVRGVSGASEGAGVRGEGSLGVFGVGSAIGVEGHSTHIGVRGEGDTYGVQGVSTNIAVFGIGGVGVSGHSGLHNGAGMHASNEATHGDAFGILAQSHSTSGRAAVGDALANSGANIGVLGRTASGGGTAMRAENTANGGSGNALQVVGNAASGDSLVVDANGGASSWAIIARSAGSSGRALNALLTNNAATGSAIYAQVNGAGARAGQFVNLGGGTAASFTGNVDVSGTLSKGGGSFKIDHPLDPENKFLYHSFVESPDMMNIYNGNVVTGKDGYATIDLPEWFDTLNRDFRYQLTVIGSFAQAIVAEEIEGNRFVIQTSAPAVKVSWQVTGVRQDPWAEANRIEVEVEKSASERGKYLHPEAFGLSRDKGLGFAQDGKRED